MKTKEWPTWYLVTLTYLLSVTVGLTFNVLIAYEIISDTSGITFPDGTGPIAKYLTLIVFGPLFETFIFQHLLNIFFSWFKKLPFEVGWLLSAILFASTHLYSIFYFVYAFYGGLLYYCLYEIVKQKNGSPFLIVSMAHALHNLTGVILEDVLRII